MWIEMSKDLDSFIPPVYYVFNQFWLMQIIICLCYCIKAKKFLPNARNSKHPAILQFNLVLLTNGILFILEMIATNIIQLNFNSCLHHLIALLIFILTLFQQNMICVFYLIPYLFHSLYWYFEFQYDYLLCIYNVSLFLTAFVVTFFSYSKCNISLKIPLMTFSLFQINMFTYFYDDNLNLRKVEISKFMTSLTLSFLSTVPFYFYLLHIKNSMKFANKYSAFCMSYASRWTLLPMKPSLIVCRV